MLDNVDIQRKEKYAAGDVYDVSAFQIAPRYIPNMVQQVAAPLLSARPKLQKWISDAESEDPESLGAPEGSGAATCQLIYFIAVFLQMNDQINNVLNRFEAFKKGDYVTLANAIPSNLGGS